MCLFVEKLLSFEKSMRPRAKRSLKEPSRDALIEHTRLFMQWLVGWLVVVSRRLLIGEPSIRRRMFLLIFLTILNA